MTELQPASGIYEDDLIQAQPAVRAQTIRRLELIWEACAPHITGDGGKPDPRFIEAGIRCLDREIRLYRLDQPHVAGSTAPAASVEAQRQAAIAGVEELEARMERSGTVD
jgi:hypothetical protein